MTATTRYAALATFSCIAQDNVKIMRGKAARLSLIWGMIVVGIAVLGLADANATLNPSNAYEAEVRWGGESAKWRSGGHWSIGARGQQRAVMITAKSADQGATLEGRMQYKGEGPISFKATYVKSNLYNVEVKWGGGSWKSGGQMLLGARTQRLNQIQITSADQGETFSGKITYQGEGPISFKARALPSTNADNHRNIENSWGGKWHTGGIWSIGGRSAQRAVEVKITSSDGGQTFSGTMKYKGEGNIRFKARLISGNFYQVQNQWGSSGWKDGGVWVIGGRITQRAVMLDITSPDGGQTWAGKTQYKGEGPIGFRTKPGPVVQSH